MKKMILAASIATIMGLTFYAAQHSKVDEYLDLKKDGEKTYIVKVDGELDANKKLADANRNRVMAQLASALPADSYEITHVYDTLFNGFAVKVNSAFHDVIENTTGVSYVQEEHQYARPEVESYPTSLRGITPEEYIIQQKMENYSAQTMHATPSEIAEAIQARGYDANRAAGAGVSIGIIDTGLFMNQVSGSEARTKAEQDAEKGKYELRYPAFIDLDDEIAPMGDDQVKAAKLDHDYTRINNKIFYAYDYAGGDTNVDPGVATQEHGTHVASMAAANGYDFQGIAPNAQLAIFKVFADQGGGASTSAIMSAIQDATKLGIDVVNLSLGSDLYDYDDSYDESTNQVIAEARQKGTIVNFAAGNAGKSSFSSHKGYADFSTSTVETGILGSHANSDEDANIVASSNPDRAFYDSIALVKKADEENANPVAFKDQVVSSSTQTFDQDRYMTDLIPEGEDTVTVDYVYVPGYGEDSDYLAIGGEEAVKGKVAVVNRGQTTFVSKYQLAEKYGAVALIVINNDPSVTFNFSMAFSDNSPNIPVCFVFQNTIPTWGTYKPSAAKDAEPSIDNAGGVGTMTLARNVVEDAADGNIISSFSSDGPAYNLDLGPTITAPGSLTMGAIHANTKGENSGIYGYDNLSGTSMATPNFTGAFAAALSEWHPQFGGMKVANEEAFEEKKSILSNIAMSTADQITDTSKTTIGSPRNQGAGRVNVASMLEAESYILTKNNKTEGFSNEYQAKAELKNDGSLFVEDGNFAEDNSANYIEFDYTVYNESNVERTYNPSIAVMIPRLRIQVTHDTYAAEEESSRSETIGYDKNVKFDENDLSTYPKFVGVPTISVNDDFVTNPNGDGYVSLGEAITVPANGAATGTVKFRFDNLQFEKDFGDSKVENFSGTVKEYFAKYFKDGAGSFVEGFLKLEEATPKANTTLTLPYMGFYGDYNAAYAVEPFDFEKDPAHVYDSDLTDNYMQGLNEQYAKPNAYTGSTLSATGSNPSSTVLNQIGEMQKSALANGSDFLSVTGADNNTLYAGAPGISDKLVAIMFVNRSLTSATWSVTKDGASTPSAKGTFGDLFKWQSGYSVNTSMGINKSFLVTDDTGYVLHRAYACMDISKVPEGNYKLKFEFNVHSTGKTQVKEYSLVIDKTAPELVSTAVRENGSRYYLDLVARGNNNTAKFNTTNTVVPTLVEGTSDDYKSSYSFNAKTYESNKIHVILTDYAHNELALLVHPQELYFSVGSTFFTNKNDFAIVNYGTNGSYDYTIEIQDAKGNAITPKADYVLYIQLETGLNSEDIIVSVDGEDGNFTYDAASGMLAIKMPKDAAYFSLNFAPKGSPEDTGTTSTTEPTTETSEPTTETSEPTTTSTTAPEGTTSSEGEKKGCGGSVVAASTIAGSLALLGTAIAFKKKREDK